MSMVRDGMKEGADRCPRGVSRRSRAKASVSRARTIRYDRMLVPWIVVGSSVEGGQGEEVPVLLGLRWWTAVELHRIRQRLWILRRPVVAVVQEHN